jgi:hypothetical protein
MHRRPGTHAMTILECTAALSLMLVAAATLTMGHSQRQNDAAWQQRSADRELARGLLQQFRAGHRVALPEGWSAQRRSEDGYTVLRLHSPRGLTLEGLIP